MPAHQSPPAEGAGEVELRGSAQTEVVCPVPPLAGVTGEAGNGPEHPKPVVVDQVRAFAHVAPKAAKVGTLIPLQFGVASEYINSAQSFKIGLVAPPSTVFGEVEVRVSVLPEVFCNAKGKLEASAPVMAGRSKPDPLVQGKYDARSDEGRVAGFVASTGTPGYPFTHADSELL